MEKTCILLNSELISMILRLNVGKMCFNDNSFTAELAFLSEMYSSVQVTDRPGFN